MATGNCSKKVQLQLVGSDGNAFAILGRFQRAARRQGWSAEAIQAVMQDAMSGDYNHLLAAIMEHTEEVSRDDDEAGSSWAS